MWFKRFEVLRKERQEYYGRIIHTSCAGCKLYHKSIRKFRLVSPES